jgi:FtsH-binding integral membrane protein
VLRLSTPAPAHRLTGVNRSAWAAAARRATRSKLANIDTQACNIMDTTALLQSRFAIPKMDCASEERLVRMALEGSDVRALEFDLAGRQLTVVHGGAAQDLLSRLQPLGLGAQLLASDQAPASTIRADAQGDQEEARVLKLLLAINGVMFLVEIVLGVWAQSTGLIADSLDMFADAAVYSLALLAVGQAASRKVRAARVAGWLQALLALGALAEVARRVIFGSEPESTLMMAVGALALVANASCLVLVARRKDAGAHMKASYIFSANDVIANAGVIAAGLLVRWTGTPYPDFVIGTVIALVVLHGARRILALR